MLRIVGTVVPQSCMTAIIAMLTEESENVSEENFPWTVPAELLRFSSPPVNPMQVNCWIGTRFFPSFKSVCPFYVFNSCCVNSENKISIHIPVRARFLFVGFLASVHIFPCFFLFLHRTKKFVWSRLQKVKNHSLIVSFFVPCTKHNTVLHSKPFIRVCVISTIPVEMNPG